MNLYGFTFFLDGETWGQVITEHGVMIYTEKHYDHGDFLLMQNSYRVNWDRWTGCITAMNFSKLEDKDPNTLKAINRHLDDAEPDEHYNRLRKAKEKLDA